MLLRSYLSMLLYGQARCGDLVWRAGVLRALLDAVQAVEAAVPGGGLDGSRGTSNALRWLCQARTALTQPPGLN